MRDWMPRSHPVSEEACMPDIIVADGGTNIYVTHFGSVDLHCDALAASL